MTNLLKEFLLKYDSGNFKFNNVKYRQGARITCSFGLSEGFRIIDKKFYWDTIRLHLGVDRSGIYNRNSQAIENIILCPFDITKCSYTDYGKDHIYGSVTRLFVENEFEIRIMHITPEDINPDIKSNIVRNRDTYIGKAGDYGTASDNAHTHTEIVSIGNTSKLLNELIKEQYGEQHYEYSSEEIIIYSRQFDFLKNKSDEEILEVFKEEKDRKLVDFVNKYFLKKKDWFQGNIEATWYSSELLFNGL